jgi:NMD protein affecting ribosome stability and mRNA decay
MCVRKKVCAECEHPAKEYFDGLCAECAVHETVLNLMTEVQLEAYFTIRNDYWAANV